MNLFKRLYLRAFKNIEVHNPNNITIGDGTTLSNSSILNAKVGRIILGNSTRIGNSSELVPFKSQTIEIKDYTTLYSNCKILGQVTIERYGLLATNIYMSSGNHSAFEYPELLIRTQDQIVSSKRANINNPIHIHEDVWIGNGVFIASGITIGRGAVIGAGAIITKDVEPYTVVVGNPGKVMKKRIDFQPPLNLNAQNQNDWPYFYQGFDHKNSYPDQNSKGFKVIDEAFMYLSKKVNRVGISGYSEQSITLKIEVLGSSLFSIDIRKGEFSIEIPEIKSNNFIYTIIKIPTLNSSIFINSVISN